MSTPKPWKLILHGNEQYPYPLSIHSQDGSEWITRDGTVSSLDHARLIAASPTMYEALRMVALYENAPEVLKAVDAAIAKAEGREG